MGNSWGPQPHPPSTPLGPCVVDAPTGSLMGLGVLTFSCYTNEPFIARSGTCPFRLLCWCIRGKSFKNSNTMPTHATKDPKKPMRPRHDECFVCAAAAAVATAAAASAATPPFVCTGAAAAASLGVETLLATPPPAPPSPSSCPKYSPAPSAASLDPRVLPTSSHLMPCLAACTHSLTWLMLRPLHL